MTYRKPGKPSPKRLTPAEILATTKAQWKFVQDAEAEQRRLEREDLAYQLPENQWPPEARLDREKWKRPALAVSLLHQPKNIVRSQAANADLAIKVAAVGEKSDKAVAKVLEELVRRIQRDSVAQAARMWALARAIECGRGVYKIVKRYDEDADDPLDQEIGIEQIEDQSSIWFDPTAKKLDLSDGRWVIEEQWMLLSDYRVRFPRAEAFSGDDFRQFAAREPEWVSAAAGQETILVPTKYYKEYEEYEVKGQVMERCIGVKVCTLSGAEVLEEYDWGGHYLPHIPVIGNKLQPIDGKRRWEGMTRPARGAQEFFNYAITSVIEALALEGKAPYIGYLEQFKGLEKWWDEANRRPFPFLPVNMIDDATGKLLPLPQRNQADLSKMSLGLQAVQLAQMLVQSATAIYDPGLGQASNKQESGKKVLALQQQGDASNSQYLWNLANLSMPYEGRVILDLIPSVYDSGGRVIQVLGGENEARSIMLGAWFITDPETGQPQKVRKGTPGAQYYDIWKGGRYSVAVKVGKSYQTRLEEAREDLGQLLPNLPPEVQLVLLPNYLRYREAPGSEEAADLMKRFRDAKIPGLKDEGEPMSSDDLKGKVAAQEQAMKDMQMQLQQAVQVIQTDQAKQQASMAKTQADVMVSMAKIQSEERIAAANNETKLAIEGMAQRMEAMQALLLRSHETAQQHEKMAHETALAAAGGQTMTRSSNRSREDGREDEESREDGQSQQTGMEQESGYEQPPTGGAEA